MKKLITTIFLVLLVLASCSMKQKADFIGFNAKIYTVDSTFSIAEAFAVKDGKFVAVGSNSYILANYKVDKDKQDTNYKDFSSKFIYPGFNDSHCHLFSLGQALTNVDLRGASSFDQIIDRLKEAYVKNPNQSFLIGEGWDQNLWEKKEFPNNKLLNEAFPNIPVILTRIDYHAVVVNQKAIDCLKLTPDLFTNAQNAKQLEHMGAAKEHAIIKNGEFTGVFMENMCVAFADSIIKYSTAQKRELFLLAQKECIKYGLSSISDAEESLENILIIDSLVNEEKLILNLDVWLSASKENMEHFTKPYYNKNLRVETLKLYKDGALGSRGASLLEAYSDSPNNYGIEVTSTIEFDEYCAWAYNHNFRVACHCIGDSANRSALNSYAKFLKGKNNLGWRIEHAQIISPSDIDKFSKYSIIPSIQPTHCTSDMFWADERLGARIKDAYKYKELLDQLNWIPCGTDFPIENVNPILTFFAAVYRQNTNFLPTKGFQMNNSLNKEQALRSMTIWGAKASFEQDKKGSIEIGKQADFVVLSKDIIEVAPNDLLNTKVEATYIGGVNYLP